MIGPAEEVKKQRDAFFEYMRSFEAIYDHKIDSSVEEAEMEAKNWGGKEVDHGKKI